MANPFRQGLSAPANGPFGDMTKMVSEFNKFRQSFQGDPKAEVQKLLQSGQLSQAELNQLQAMAQQIRPFIRL